MTNKEVLEWARKKKYRASINLAHTSSKKGATEAQIAECRRIFEIWKYICKVLEE